METTIYLNQGRDGTIKADASWKEENNVLKALFPEKYWKATKELTYDFKANYSLALSMGAKYFFGMLSVEAQTEEEAARFMPDAELEAAAGNGIQLVRFKIAWLNNLWTFFETGAAKQKLGLKPKIMIK